MGKKNKIKKLKFKNKKAPSSNSGNQKIEENCNKESAPEGEESPKNEITEEIRHKKKESRKKMKKLRKKNKKKKKINLDYEGLYDFEEFFMNQEDIEKLPHDTFTTFNVPTTIEENKQYISSLISESDIILELLDARDIYHSKNTKIEELVNNSENKLLIYVITKSDLVSEDYLNKIKKSLEEKNNNKNPIIITSSIIREKIKLFFDELKEQIKKLHEKNMDKLIKVGIVGAPNVGKNALIQSLELIVNSNCDDKYIYFDEEKTFCVNSVPCIAFDEDDNNSFLISKKYKEVKDVPEPMKLISNLMNIMNKEKLKDIYELNKAPENLDEFISLIKEKYEFQDNNITLCQILEDIISGKISYEVNI
jgi:ethanolamine utilization protein EutP (predicted NTPase)